jgi:protein-disulfide isomerase
MDEQNTPPQQEVENEPKAAEETASASAFDITKFLLPGAILLAGLMISGTILYINYSKAQLLQPTGEEVVLDAKNFKKWAKDLRLNTSEFSSCIESSKFTQEITKDIQDGTSAGVEGTPTFFINGVKIVGAQPFENFKAIIDQALTGKPVAGAVAVSIDDDPVLGNPNAPVTIVEFSDFQCPFWAETLPQLKEAYIDTGKAKLIYRDFPLAFHPGAEPAAQAANCANEQGKYWEMHDKIFGEQVN